MPVEVNIADRCNAFWDGTGLNFFQAGGGCPNTAYADVVMHEFGHAMDASFGGILDSGLSEGTGDALALIGTRQSCVGRDFFGPGTCLRQATDIVNWPLNPGEDPHEQGRRYAGFVWSLITGLQSIYQPDQAFAVAKSLVLGAAFANPANIPDAVRLSFIVDDDDGNSRDMFPAFPDSDRSRRLRRIPRPADCHQGTATTTTTGALHLLLGRQ